MYAIQRLLNILHRIRDAESDKAFAPAAERSARQTRDSGLLQQGISKLLRLPSSSFDIREDVEGAVRHLTAEAPESIQFAHHEIASSAKLFNHSLYRRLIAMQRFDPSHLRKARGA